MEDRTLASLTIHEGASMSPERRRTIALWLRRQARFVEVHGHAMAPRFRARFLLPEEVTREEGLERLPVARG